MATSASQRCIAAGDLVIVFAVRCAGSPKSRDRTPTPLVVTPGAQLVNLFGTFPHDRMIDKPYGSKVRARH